MKDYIIVPVVLVLRVFHRVLILRKCDTQAKPWITQNIHFLSKQEKGTFIISW